MVPQAKIFTYTDAEIDQVERTLSPDRYQGYLHKANGDRRKALTLYEKNVALSEAMYGVIQGLEVALRNCLNDRLIAKEGAQWYSQSAGLLVHPQDQMVIEAEKGLQRRRKSPTNGRMVAELSLGFWTGLIGRQYEQTLWRTCLHAAFPHAKELVQQSGGAIKIVKMKRSQIAEAIDAIRRLRNRIAHHEPILDENITNRYHEIILAIGWCALSRQLGFTQPTLSAASDVRHVAAKL